MGRNHFWFSPRFLFGPLSILGPLWFNIFICDLFLIMNKVDFASYADDKSYAGIKEVINSLKEASRRIILRLCRQSNESKS